VNTGMRRLSAWTHFAQYAVEWGWEPKPEWFDHFLDQHWQWSARNNGGFVERGVFSRLVLKPDAKVLELCCGDGFNTRHFYSSRASSILALDFDPRAIAHARRHNAAANIRYAQADIRQGLPKGPFDNVIWDAAIEHFTESEIDQVLRALVHLLGPSGILSGFTITERSDGRKSNALHEYEFKDLTDLKRFLTPHFKFVRAWETFYPTRHNLYFVASQTSVELFADPGGDDGERERRSREAPVVVAAPATAL